jgi:tetratricopeptide (TPR) repeat protein
VRAAHNLLSGHLAINTGDIDRAAAELSAGYAEFQQLGDRFGIMVCLGGLAEVAMATGEPAEAVRLLEESRELAAEGMAGNFKETVRVPLGRARAAAGDVEGGKAELEDAVRTAERLGELDDAAQGYVELGEIARRECDLTRARTQLDRAMEIVGPRQRRPDMTFVAARCLTKLGCLAEQEGDLDEAGRRHRQALVLVAESSFMLRQSNQTVAVVVEGIAALAAARGEHARAAELLGLARALQGFRNDASLEAARTRTASSLSDPDFEAAYAAGRRLTLADALALTP